MKVSFRRTVPIISVAILGGAMGAAPLNGDVYTYRFDLDASQEVPPNNSIGTGQAIVSLDTDTGELTWSVRYQDLTGTATAAHFHGPAPRGTNAGIQVGLDHTQNPIEGSTSISSAQMDQLLDGLWYINIHTQMFPGGEIRGQVDQCLMLSLDQLVAGQNTMWTATNAQPGFRVAFVWGTAPGVTNVNNFGGYCASFNIQGVTQARLLGQPVANGSGVAALSRMIPGNASGLNVTFQAAQNGTCPDHCMSNTVSGTVQ
jgi:hypothetical protein